MNVSGYICHINNVASQITDLAADWVYLDDMRIEFLNYKSWKELNNDNSELVVFLKQICKYDGQWSECISEQHIHFSMRKLKILGLLFCDGSKYEKASQLFDLAVEGRKQWISDSDIDMKYILETMFNLSTELIYRQSETRLKDQFELDFQFFIDDVFGLETKLKKDIWITNAIA